ncbi:hypothetical protein V6N12_058335 [Hibiscus sabdariffa]|uniref:Uncharacterized protein n=1 Tax=Hibiscus sabdariffa TaxID=183260 RepID=A0ABR2EUG1_9ROSI
MGLWESNKSIVLLGEAVKCRTLDGDSPVAESITSLRSDPSSMGHVESRVNQQGPPCKAKYSWENLEMSLVVLEITVVISKQSIKIKSETSDSFLLERKKEGYKFPGLVRNPAHASGRTTRSYLGAQKSGTLALPDSKPESPSFPARKRMSGRIRHLRLVR